MTAEKHNPESRPALERQPAVEPLDGAADLAKICNRWKRDVYAFCRSFVGDERAAEDTTCEVLLTICRRNARQTNRSEIVGLAFDLVRKQACQSRPPHRGISRLENSILRLSAAERAVVIMRNLLRMDWPEVALATGLSAKRTHELWIQGVIQLNEALQRDIH